MELDDFDDPPKPRKGKWVKDPHATLEERVRAEVLKSPEDWLTAKYVSQSLRAGNAHVVKVLAKMVTEGVLSPLCPVPTVDDPRVKVGRRPIEDGSYDITAFVHEGKWVIGYFDKSSSDARKTVLVHARPDLAHLQRTSRVRGRRCARGPTVRMQESYRNSFRYKLADWDGLAHLVLRNGQPFIDACLAIGVEPKTDLPWTCACGRKNDASDGHCSKYECHKPKPKLLKPPEEKICPDCGQPDVDGHSKRHRGKKLYGARQKCLQKVVEIVHKA